MADDVLGDRIVAADPLRPGGPGPEVDGALLVLREGILHMSSSSSSPRRHRRVVAAIGAVAVFGAGVSAAAATDNLPGFLVGEARTGEHAEGGENGTGEVIRLDAPDAAAVVGDIVGDTPLPPGGSLDAWVATITSQGYPNEIAESGLRGSALFVSACQWTTYWLGAQETDDGAAVADVEAAFDAMATSPDAGRGIRHVYRDLAADVRADDVTAVRDGWYVGNCLNEDGSPSPGTEVG